MPNPLGENFPVLSPRKLHLWIESCPVRKANPKPENTGVGLHSEEVLRSSRFYFQRRPPILNSRNRSLAHTIQHIVRVSPSFS